MKKLTREELEPIFKGGPRVEKDGVDLGPSRFENDLQAEGFSKSELKRLVAQGVLLRRITKPDGKAWRATYVLPQG